MIMRVNISITLLLDDIVSNESREKEVIDYLMICRNAFSKKFKVFFVNKNLNQKQVKDFIKRNSDTLFLLNSEFTKTQIQYSWFTINLDRSFVKNWRYQYVGDLINGLDQYIKMLRYIEKKGG